MRLRPSIPVLASTLLALSACTESAGPNTSTDDPIQMGDGGPDGSVEPRDSGTPEDAGDAGPTPDACPTDACSPGGKCVAEGDSYTCECDPGYAGTGTQACADLNECLSAPCGQGACNNLAGSYACDCTEGYRFDGTACADIDECTEDASACGSDGASCTNQPGGFLCDGCPAGSKPAEGPFSACVDIDECAENPSICGNGGTCANATPGYACNDCDEGFASNDTSYPKCVDVNECALGTDTCADDQPCTNTAGSFICACLENTLTKGAACMPVLSALEVSTGALSPAFETETTSYTLALPPGVARYDLTPRVYAPGNESIEVDGQAVASGAAVTVTTPLFTQGTTTVELSVAGETTTYEVEAARAIAAFGSDTAVSGAGLGTSVAISADGSTLVAGAHTEGPGAAYVFVRTAAGWAQQARLSPTAGDASDQFGWAVKISADGNTVVVGAPLEDSNSPDDETDDNALNSGAAYVFTRSGASWTQSAYLKASNLGADDNFGWAVALAGDGNTLAIGARRESSDSKTINGPDNNLAFRAGAAYVFTRAATSWTQQAVIKAPNAEDNNLFGYGCALGADGNRLVVGALGENSDVGGVLTDTNLATGNAANAGAAYVFDRTGSAWTFSAMLKAANPVAGDFMGQFVSISADAGTIAVGAPRVSTQRGNVIVFALGQTGWTHQQTLVATTPGDGDRFGTSVSLSGDGNRLVAGAPLEDGSGRGIDPIPNDDTFDAGAIYVFTRSGANWSTPRYVKASDTLASDTEPGDQFGFAAAISADGSTMAAGSYNRDRGINRSGAVYVY